MRRFLFFMLGISFWAENGRGINRQMNIDKRIALRYLGMQTMNARAMHKLSFLDGLEFKLPVARKSEAMVMHSSYLIETNAGGVVSDRVRFFVLKGMVTAMALLGDKKGLHESLREISTLITRGAQLKVHVWKQSMPRVKIELTQENVGQIARIYLQLLAGSGAPLYTDDEGGLAERLALRQDSWAKLHDLMLHKLEHTKMDARILLKLIALHTQKLSTFAVSSPLESGGEEMFNFGLITKLLTTSWVTGIAAALGKEADVRRYLQYILLDLNNAFDTAHIVMRTDQAEVLHGDEEVLSNDTLDLFVEFYLEFMQN